MEVIIITECPPNPLRSSDSVDIAVVINNIFKRKNQMGVYDRGRSSRWVWVEERVLADEGREARGG